MKKFHNFFVTEKLDINPTINSIQDINTCIEKLIQSTVDQSLYSRNSKRTRNSIPPEILIKIREKNRLRRNLKLTHDTQLKRAINSKTKFVKAILKTYSHYEWDNYLISLNHKENSMYTMYNCRLKRNLPHIPYLAQKVLPLLWKKKQNFSLNHWKINLPVTQIQLS